MHESVQDKFVIFYFYYDILFSLKSEKLAKDMILNCKTNGLPPAFIYFMFTNNKTDGINITEQLLKEEKEAQFTR